MTRCPDCAHFRKPGKSNGYCCGRDDLPRAYGAHHPLRKLPEDCGKNCAVFELKPALFDRAKPLRIGAKPFDLYAQETA